MQVNDNDPQKAVFGDEATQKRLNEPLKDPSGMSAGDQEFLNLIISFVNDGKIDLYKPSSLLNSAVYEALSDDLKAKSDLEAMNLLNSIRDIKGLYDAGYTDSYQIGYLVAEVRMEKERIEGVSGDIFII